MKVIKIGGNIIDDEQKLEEFVSSFSKIEGDKILVHGGGKIASNMAKKLGVAVKMVDGRRITDDDMLEVVTMVYAGLVNKKIVSMLQSHGVNALGLSGADANVLLAEKRVNSAVDFGNVGDVKKVASGDIMKFVNMGLTPVFSAITHDGNAQLLNTNADTIASEIAKSLVEFEEVELIYIFELLGVMADISDENSVFENINLTKYLELKSDGVIVDGMIPKLDNSFAALEDGVKSVRIASISYINDANAKHTCLSLA